MWKRCLRQSAIIALGVGASALSTELWAAGAPVIWSTNGHSGAVHKVAFSPDEQFLASGGDDGVLNVWRVSDGRRVLSATNGGGYLHGVAFSPKSNLLAAAAYITGGAPHLGTRAWSVPDFTLVWTNMQLSRDLAFSPDGELIAGCFSSEYGPVFLLRATNGALAQPWFGVRDFGYRTVAFAPDGSRLLAGFVGLRIFSTATWTRERDIEEGEVFAISPDSRMVAAPGKTYRLLDGSVDQVFEGTNLARSLCYGAGGRLVLGACSGNTISIWNADTGKIALIYIGAGDAVAIGSSPRGNLFAWGTADGTITLGRAPLWVSRFERHGDQVLIEWAGGKPPYQVQHRNNLIEGEWNDIGAPGDLRSATISNAAPGFYRVQSDEP